MKTIKSNLKYYGILNVNGKLKSAYADSINIVERIVKGEQYKPFSWSRNGGRYKLIGDAKADRVEYLILSCNVEYHIGNDSPRQGKEHDYIYINKEDRAKLKRNIETIKKYI